MKRPRSTESVGKEDGVLNRFVEEERKVQKQRRLTNACRKEVSTPQHEFNCFWKDMFHPRFKQEIGDEEILDPHVWDWRCQTETEDQWRELSERIPGHPVGHHFKPKARPISLSPQPPPPPPPKRRKISESIHTSFQPESPHKNHQRGNERKKNTPGKRRRDGRRNGMFGVPHHPPGPPPGPPPGFLPINGGGNFPHPFHPHFPGDPRSPLKGPYPPFPPFPIGGRGHMGGHIIPPPPFPGPHMGGPIPNFQGPLGPGPGGGGNMRNGYPYIGFPPPPPPGPPPQSYLPPKPPFGMALF